MASELTGRERLRLAGLDLDLPLSGSAPGGDAAALQKARFCAYSGRELVLTVDQPGATPDAALIGADAFTRAGRILRYAPGGGRVTVVGRATAPAELRGTVDLVACSTLPLPDDAVLRSMAEAPAERLQLVAPGMADVTAVTLRHGRLFVLQTPSPQQHNLQAWKLPKGGSAEGWRPQRVRGLLGPPNGHRPGSTLRASETLVYLNLPDGLMAWDLGTGEHLVQWPWPQSTCLPLVRIAFDRVLVVREEDGAQIAEVYDLTQVAGGPCPPLPGQARRLCAVPGAEAHPPWAEACGDQFVLISADGRVHVFPFDAPSWEAFANTEAVRLAPPSFRRRADGLPELLSFVHNERGRWLLRVPLDATLRYEFERLRDEPLASYDLAPCTLGRRLINAHVAGDENLEISRCVEDRTQEIDERAEVPATFGSRLFRVLCGSGAGQPYVAVHYAQNTHRLWLCGTSLQRLLVDPPYPQVRAQNDVRVFWDAGGLYLCDLTEGVVYARRPQT